MSLAHICTANVVAGLSPPISCTFSEVNSTDLIVTGTAQINNLIQNGPVTFDEAPEYPTFALQAPAALAIDATATTIPVVLAPGNLVGGAAVSGLPSAFTVSGTLGVNVALVPPTTLQIQPPQDLRSTAGPSFLQETLTATTNQLFLGASGHVDIINAVAPAAASQTIAVPDSGAGSTSFVLAHGSSTLVGAKTFSSGVAITPVSNQLTLGAAGHVSVINALAPVGVTQTIAIPDSGIASTQFVLANGASTIAGARTFDTAIAVGPNTNQLLLGTTKPVTLSAPVPADSFRVQFPDPGLGAGTTTNVFYTDTVGAQTISGPVTFSQTPSVPVHFRSQFQAGVQSLPDATITTVTNMTNDFGAPVGFPAPIAGVFTPSTPGIYMITAFVTFAASATGDRSITIVGDLSGSLAGQRVRATAAGVCTLSTSWVLLVDAVEGDNSFHVTAYQNSGGALNISPCQISIYYLGKKN